MIESAVETGTEARVRRGKVEKGRGEWETGGTGERGTTDGGRGSFRPNISHFTVSTLPKFTSSSILFLRCDTLLFNRTVKNCSASLVIDC